MKRFLIASVIIAGLLTGCSAEVPSESNSTPTTAQTPTQKTPQDPVRFLRNQVRVLRHQEHRVFKQYTNKELTGLLLEICIAKSSGVGNFAISKHLITSGISFDATTLMVAIAPDFC